MRQTILFAKKHILQAFLFHKVNQLPIQIMIFMLALKMGIFKVMSTIPQPQPWMSFILAWTQLEIKHNARMNQLCR
jgi:hypothetical protein